MANIKNKGAAKSKSRKPTPETESLREYWVSIDRKVEPTLPLSQRPLYGLDIENWRLLQGLSTFEAQSALGIRNHKQYQTLCLSRILPPLIEVILRLYIENPVAPGWKKWGLRDLFLKMYGPQLEIFEAKELQDKKTAAWVDLGNRFCGLFFRSTSRKYDWLGMGNQTNVRNPERDPGGLYADVEIVLRQLYAVRDPGATFERVVGQVMKLRGQDLDDLYAIPTPERLPKRRKSGRQPVQAADNATEAKPRAVRKVASAAKKKPPAKQKAKA